MQSPPVEWSLGIGYLAALDYIRSRGEADHDTLSEVVRNGVARIPHGDLVLAAALAGGSTWFWRHIVIPLRTSQETH